jgi:hypothetical protein
MGLPLMDYPSPVWFLHHTTTTAQSSPHKSWIHLPLHPTPDELLKNLLTRPQISDIHLLTTSTCLLQPTRPYPPPAPCVSFIACYAFCVSAGRVPGSAQEFLPLPVNIRLSKTSFRSDFAAYRTRYAIPRLILRNLSLSCKRLEALYRPNKPDIDYLHIAACICKEASINKA